jgi:hypothetical protein
MIRRMLAFLSVLCAATFAAAHFVMAAVPVSVIEGWQKAASEVVTFTVVALDETSKSRLIERSGPAHSVTDTNVILTVKVDSVQRTASGLAPGASIVLRYAVRRYEPVAPPDGNFGVILRVGDKATAYLKKGAAGNLELAGPVGCLIPSKP